MIFLPQAPSNVVLRIREPQPHPSGAVTAKLSTLFFYDKNGGVYPSTAAGSVTAVLARLPKIAADRPTPSGNGVTAQLVNGPHTTVWGANLFGPLYPVTTPDYVQGGSVSLVFPTGSGERRTQYVLGDSVLGLPADSDYVRLQPEGNVITTPDPGLIEVSGAITLGFTVSSLFKHGVGAAGAVGLAIEASGSVEHTNEATSGVGAAQLQLVAEGYASHGIGGSGNITWNVSFEPEGHAAHGESAHGAATIDFVASGEADHATGVRGSISLSITADGMAQHTRYEVRGDVRESEGGLLLTRRVRVCHRQTGVLVGQQDSISGKFKIHCGLQPEEYVIYSVDPTGVAEEYRLPAQNRVISVLAQDVA